MVAIPYNVDILLVIVWQSRPENKSDDTACSLCAWTTSCTSATSGFMKLSPSFCPRSVPELKRSPPVFKRLLRDYSSLSKHHMVLLKCPYLLLLLCLVLALVEMHAFNYNLQYLVIQKMAYFLWYRFWVTELVDPLLAPIAPAVAEMIWMHGGQVHASTYQATDTCCGTCWHPWHRWRWNNPWGWATDKRYSAVFSPLRRCLKVPFLAQASQERAGFSLPSHLWNVNVECCTVYFPKLRKYCWVK